MPHDMDDMTDYCRKCGVSWRQIVRDRVECATGNVVGISHVIARGKMKAYIRAVYLDENGVCRDVAESGMEPPCG